MSERWVIDASIGLAWIHPAQANERTDELLRQLKLGASLIVPPLWFLETANALLVLERRKKLKRAERLTALSLLRGLNAIPDLDGTQWVYTTISELATTYGLSVYDASYLELAQREHLSLGTKDAPLRAAAQKCKVKLLEV